MYHGYLIKFGHVNAQLNPSGLYIHQHHVFIGASPDLLVSCDCCGEGLVEFKSPYEGDKVVNVTETLQGLVYLDNDLRLKKNHNYYAQVQGQMAITNRLWCDFAVVIAGDVFVQRIQFDEDFWKVTQQSLVSFFEEYVLEEIITQQNRPIAQKKAIRAAFSKKTCAARKIKINSDREAEADTAIMNVISVLGVHS